MPIQEMNKSEIFAKNNQDLRHAVLSEIASLVRQHEGLKIEAQFNNPIETGRGHDECEFICEVSQTHAFIHYKGNLNESKKLSELSTDILIEIVDGLEKNLSSITVQK